MNFNFVLRDKFGSRSCVTRLSCHTVYFKREDSNGNFPILGSGGTTKSVKDFFNVDSDFFT
jgi:hypothetical protein